MARPEVLNRLKELGWDGPTSYTLPYLLEMTELLEGGMTVDALKESRRKTSVKVEKQPKGEWVAYDDNPGVTDEPDPQRVYEKDGVNYRLAPDGSGGWEKFVPTVKQPKAKKEKGTWEECENPFTEEEGWGVAVDDGEFTFGTEGRYRKETRIDDVDLSGPEATGNARLVWFKFVPTPKKVGKIKAKQEASFDPREMLRVFENENVRVRTGGRDWTLVDIDFLEAQLKAAQETGAAAVVIDLDGSQESADVPWLEALVAVKKRLALREETGVNGDAAHADAGGA